MEGPNPVTDGSLRAGRVRRIVSVLFTQLAVHAALLVCCQQIVWLRFVDERRRSLIFTLVSFKIVMIWMWGMFSVFKDTLNSSKPTATVCYAFLSGLPASVLTTLFEVNVLLLIYPAAALWCIVLYALSCRGKFDTNSIMYAFVCGMLIIATMAAVWRHALADEISNGMSGFVTIMFFTLLFIYKLIVDAPEDEIIPEKDCEPIAQQLYVFLTALDAVRIFG